MRRQYSGTAGRIENCWLGVFLTYATADGARAFIGRRLYLPERSWAADRERCLRGGVPDEVVFATKPETRSRRCGKGPLGYWVPACSSNCCLWRWAHR